MATDNSRATYSGKLSSVKTVFQGSNVGVINNYGQPENERYQACIAALRQPDPQVVLKQVRQWVRMTEGTCEWVLSDAMFRTWQSNEGGSSLIWIGGPSDMGKTTTALYIVDYLERTYSDHDEFLVLYYFCDKQEPDRKNAASILKGLILHLYKKQKHLVSVLYEKYRYETDLLFERRSVYALWTVFQDMLDRSGKKRIFCVIDGIDQCHAKGYERELENLMRMINSHFTGHDGPRTAADTQGAEAGGECAEPPRDRPSSSGPELRMMILTCQSPSCVVQELSPFPRIAQDTSDHQAGGSDVQRHIATSVNDISIKCSASKSPTPQVIGTVSTALNACEDPNFVWVNLVAEKLSGMTQSEMKKYVKKAPKSVEELHIQTLLDVPSGRRVQLVAVMKWVVFAVRPLSPLELTKAVKYTLATSFSRKKLNKILAFSSGLIETQKDKIMLASSSVRELLTAKHSLLKQNKKLRDFAFDDGIVHSELANACVAYLQGTANLKKGRRVRLNRSDKLTTTDDRYLCKHPFLEYTMVHWPTHAKNGTHEKTDYANRFFLDDAGRRKIWWRSYWISLRQNLAWKWTTPGGFSLLHLAAFFDIVPLAMHVEQTGGITSLVGAEDHQGMKPINWATERCNTAMVKFLLERGDSDDETLRTAARTGEASIVAMLLESRNKMLRSPKPVSPGSWPVTPTSPLQFIRKTTLGTISEWSKKLDNTADGKSGPLSPTAEGYGTLTSETPMHIAATCGHDEVLQVLLDNGEDVDRATGGGWTALHNAAWFGRLPAIDLLVAAGADINAKTKEGLTPLHCAIRNDQMGTVERLLSKPAVEDEARDMFGLTPFHMACKMDNIPIMEILLDYGASIETKTRQGWTPLIWACVHGRLTVAEFLLTKGADIDAKWSQMVAEAQGAIELGPIGVAKAYWDNDPQGSEPLTRLLEKYGAVDTDRLTGVDPPLPLVDSVIEAYSVPMIAGVVVMDDGANDDDSEPVDSDGSIGSEEESDSSASSDEDLDSLKQSSANVSQEAESSEIFDTGVLGLGINEEPDDVAATLHSVVGDNIVDYAAQPDLEEASVGDSQVASADIDTVHIGRNTPHSGGLVTQDTAVDIHLQPSVIAADDGMPGESSNSSEVNKRSSSVPTLGSLSDRFRRFAPSKSNSTPHRKVETTYVASEAPNKAIVETSDNKRDADSIASGKRLDNATSPGRFEPSRMFSWKSDKSSETTKSASLQGDGARSPRAVAGADFIKAEPDVVDPIKPGVLGRLTSVRALSWKRESNDDSGKSRSAPSAIIEGDENEAIRNTIDMDASNSGDHAVDESHANAASAPVPDRQSGQGLFNARKLFGLRVAKSEQDSIPTVTKPESAMDAKKKRTAE